MVQHYPEIATESKSRSYWLRALRLSWPAILFWLLLGCAPDNVPLGPNEPAAEGQGNRSLAVDAAREGVIELQLDDARNAQKVHSL